MESEDEVSKDALSKYVKIDKVGEGTYAEVTGKVFKRNVKINIQKHL